MDILFNAASNFRDLEQYEYECILSYNRRCVRIIIDFRDTDFFHLTGMQHLTDIDIPQNRKKTIEYIVDKKKLTEETLQKSKKYIYPTKNNDVRSRIEHLQYIEKYIDTDNFINLFTMRNPNNSGSFIEADYVIESRIDDISGDVYIFIKERNDKPEHYAVVSFFVKGDMTYSGDHLYWMKKSKLSQSKVEVLYQHPKFNDFLNQQNK